MRRTSKQMPMSSDHIPLCVPEIRGNEWTYVKECLDTGWVSSVGSYVDRFEQAVAGAAGRKYAVATSNGTSALHVSLLLAGVRPGEEVLVSNLTFIAPANAVRYVGAHPVLVDAEPEFWQMDVGLVENFLRGCRRSGNGVFNVATGRRIAAIVPVHALGHPADIIRLSALSEAFGIPVVEDATESLGASINGRPVGSHGDCACYSFNGNKILTTGGGGMIVTDDVGFAERGKYLTTQAKDDPLEYIHGEVGYNYRLTNLQAAMGCAQMELLGSYVDRKREIAQCYTKGLAGIPGLQPMREAAGIRSSFWMFTILVNREEFGMDSRNLLGRLAGEKIQSRPLWQPLHLSPAHRDCQVLGGEVSERLYRDGLSLPCSVGLSGENQERVIGLMRALAK